jgi:hypothetical protein
VLDHEFAYKAINEPDFIAEIKESAKDFQWHEVYVYFYRQIYLEFIYAFVQTPRQAVMQLEEKIPGAVEKLAWVIDFEWPVSKLKYVEVVLFADKEKRLYRVAMDVVALLSEHLRIYQDSIINEINGLINFRTVMGAPKKSSIEYLYMIEEHRKHQIGRYYYLERPFRTFYSALPTIEIVQLYEIDTIEDLFRFEFVKMIEHDIFIKKCKNCERFFIPERRVDAEYCNRIYGSTNRRCNEIGAMLRYEKKVAENPVWEAYKKTYRRFNSRTRAKKMTQTEFLQWSEEAAQKRDDCLTGNLPFDDYINWLEQGRVRKARKKTEKNIIDDR